MRRPTFVWVTVVVALWTIAASAQSLRTDGNIESDGQLVSNVATGTAPLAVSSTTMVPGLNADQVDGVEASDFALDADLMTVETMLVALQAQVDALGLALVPRTGLTTCYDGAGAVTTCGTGVGLGQDGDLQSGVNWPNPRFTKNGDGTVTDNLTALVWLEDANCIGLQIWINALAKSNALFDGCSNCGGTDNDCNLSDGSVAGQWRLPNLLELKSLAHHGVSSPAVPNTVGTGKWTEGDPFFSVQTAAYWSSTTYAVSTDGAWGINMINGADGVGGGNKTDVGYVWPVRDAP